MNFDSVNELYLKLYSDVSKSDFQLSSPLSMEFQEN